METTSTSTAGGNVRRVKSKVMYEPQGGWYGGWRWRVMERAEKLILQSRHAGKCWRDRGVITLSQYNAIPERDWVAAFEHMAGLEYAIREMRIYRIPNE